MVSSMVELQDQYEGQGLVVVAVDAGETAEVVRAFTEQHELNYLNLLGDAEVMRAYRLTGHPLTLLVTPQGSIFRQYLGWRSKQEVEQGVRALLGLPSP
jgi:hypothetical protein